MTCITCNHYAVEPQFVLFHSTGEGFCSARCENDYIMTLQDGLSSLPVPQWMEESTETETPYAGWNADEAFAF